MNGREVLERLDTIPIATWNYKAQNKSIRHIGPMAQDFAAAFNVGEDDHAAFTQSMRTVSPWLRFRACTQLSMKKMRQNRVIGKKHRRS